MNKAELITSISEKTNLTKKDSECVINAFVETVTETLKKGDKVGLVGFGTFEVKERAARTGHNPKTGAAIEIAASKIPSFKASSTLKNAVK